MSYNGTQYKTIHYNTMQCMACNISFSECTYFSKMSSLILKKFRNEDNRGRFTDKCVKTLLRSLITSLLNLCDDVFQIILWKWFHSFLLWAQNSKGNYSSFSTFQCSLSTSVIYCHSRRIHCTIFHFWTPIWWISHIFTNLVDIT